MRETKQTSLVKVCKD